MLLTFYHNVSGYRFILATIVLLSILEALLTTASIAAIIPVSGAFIGSSGSSAPWPISKLASLTDGSPYLLIILTGIVLVIKVIIAFSRQLLTAHLKLKLWEKWMQNLAAAQLFIPYQQWQKQDFGKVINLCTRELVNATSFVTSGIAILVQIFSFTSIFIAMMIVDWRFVIAGSITALVLIVSGLRPLNKLARRIGARGVTFAGDVTGLITETVQGVRDIRLLSAEGKWLKQIDHTVHRMTKNDFWGSLVQEVPKNTVEIILGILLVSIGIIFYSFSDEALLTEKLPMLLFFTAGIVRILTNGANISNLFVKLSKRYPSFLVIVEHTANAIVDQSGGSTGPQYETISKGFSLRNLHFSYGDHKVLRDVSFEIPLGSVTFLYGPSGSGKSTITDLLSRLHEPPLGTVFVDGRDATHWSITQWRDMVGYVSQDPILFSGTVFDNFKVAKPQATSDEILLALQLASAENLVLDSQDGLQGKLVERGRNLSGGQKLRLVIARALLKKPSLIILDESMGGIEASLEAEIITALRKIQSLAVLVVSHRKENEHIADQVIEVADGAVKIRIPEKMQ